MYFSRTYLLTWEGATKLKLQFRLALLNFPYPAVPPPQAHTTGAENPLGAPDESDCCGDDMQDYTIKAFLYMFSVMYYSQTNTNLLCISGGVNRRPLIFQGPRLVERLIIAHRFHSL